MMKEFLNGMLMQYMMNIGMVGATTEPPYILRQFQ